MIVKELITRWGFQVDDKKLNSFESKLNSIKTAVVSFIGLYAGKALIGAVKSASDYADAIAKQSEALGLTTDAFQQMSYAFEINGATMDDFMSSFRKLSMTVGYAQQGMKTYTRLFDELGLSIDDVKKAGSDTTSLFMLIVDKIKQMPNAVKKAEMAVQFLGRGGLKMIPTINQGSDAIKGLMTQAKDLGLILENDLIKRTVEFHDEWERASLTLKVLKTRIALSLMPTFNFFFKSIMPLGIKMGKSLVDSVNQLAESFGGWKNVLLAIGIYLTYVNLPLLALAAGIFLVIDAIGAMQGKESVFEDIFGAQGVEMLKNFAHNLGIIRDALEFITEKAFELLDVIVGVGIGKYSGEGAGQLLEHYWGTGEGKQTALSVPGVANGGSTYYNNKPIINQNITVNGKDAVKAAETIRDITGKAYKDLSTEIP